MIGFEDPFVVTFDDGQIADDESDILLLGVNADRGLILAAGKLSWHNIELMTVKGQLLRIPQTEVEIEDNGQ